MVWRLRQRESHDAVPFVAKNVVEGKKRNWDAKPCPQFCLSGKQPQAQRE
jgi:hypothetical protein